MYQSGNTPPPIINVAPLMPPLSILAARRYTGHDTRNIPRGHENTRP